MLLTQKFLRCDQCITESLKPKRKTGKKKKVKAESLKPKGKQKIVKARKAHPSCPEWLNQVDTPDPPVLVLFVIASLQLLRAGVFKQVGHNVIKQYGTKKSLVPQIEATARASGWAGR